MTMTKSKDFSEGHFLLELLFHTNRWRFQPHQETFIVAGFRPKQQSMTVIF